MTSARVATWNVLHWVHYQNHEKDLPLFLADEEERAKAVVDRVATIDSEIMCLQEVSGDALAAIVARFGKDRVHWFRLPRAPKLREGTTVLRDGSENLVIITDGVKLHAQVFDDDHSKGFIAVRCLDDTLVVSTHVSGGPEKSQSLQQLELLDGWIKNQQGRAILCGDFNLDSKTTLTSLRPGWHAAAIGSTTSVSRPKSNQLIDHILTWQTPSLGFATIEDASGISDHNIVVASNVPGKTTKS